VDTGHTRYSPLAEINVSNVKDLRGATVDSRFRAFDTRTGKEVWSVSVPAPAASTPITYKGKSGRQYVVVPDGGPGTLGVPGHFASYHEVLSAYALPRPGEAPVDLSQFAPMPMQFPPRPPGGAAGAANSAAATVPTASSQGAGTDPPAGGAGKEEFTSMCGQCHGVSTAIAVRRTPDAWHDLIQDMRARGAQGDNAKAARVQEYLSHYFGLIAPPGDGVAAPR
jgi:mono/diheme cytochrome c family protein